MTAPPVPFDEDGPLARALTTRGPGQARVRILDVPVANFVTYVTSVQTDYDPAGTHPGGGGTIVLECAKSKLHGEIVVNIPGMLDNGKYRRLRLTVPHLISFTPQGAEALAAELLAWARGEVPVPEHATEGEPS